MIIITCIIYHLCGLSIFCYNGAMIFFVLRQALCEKMLNEFASFATLIMLSAIIACYNHIGCCLAL